ncbi:hypothetical protein WAF17_04535 [Bernardetia sp. ABR2-2B]|uniref:hypothetical protein n=1 Tax=Bernardetia sp. ABR2-2B TaxID=3127472 RepID=UPI0030D20971
MKYKLVLLAFFTLFFFNNVYSQKISFENCSKCSLTSVTNLPTGNILSLYTFSYEKGDFTDYEIYIHNPSGKLLKTTKLKIEYQSSLQDKGSIITKDALYLTFYDIDFIRLLKIDFDGNIKSDKRIEVTKEEQKFYFERVSPYFPLSGSLNVVENNNEIYIFSMYKINKLRYGIMSRRISNAGKTLWTNKITPEKGSYEIKQVEVSDASVFIVSTKKAKIKEGESNRIFFIIDKNNGKLKKEVDLIHNEGTLMPSNIQRTTDGVVLSGLFFDAKDSKGVFVGKYDDNGKQTQIYTYDWEKMYSLKMKDDTSFMNPNMRLKFVASYIKDNKITLVAEEFSTGLNLMPDLSIMLTSFYISPNNKNQILGNVVTLAVDLSTGNIESKSLNKIHSEAIKVTLTGIMPKAEVKLIGLLDDFGYTRIIRTEVFNEKIFLLLKKGKNTFLFETISDGNIEQKDVDTSDINPKYGLYIYISSGKILYKAVEKKEYSVWQESF